jgi:hypothetical protein
LLLGFIKGGLPPSKLTTSERDRIRQSGATNAIEDGKPTRVR